MLLIVECSELALRSLKDIASTMAFELEGATAMTLKGLFRLLGQWRR